MSVLQKNEKKTLSHLKIKDGTWHYNDTELILMHI